MLFLIIIQLMTGILIIYTEDFIEKSDALKREHQIKSYKGGRAFKKLLRTVENIGDVA